MDRLLKSSEVADMLSMTQREVQKNRALPRVEIPGTGKRPLIRFKESDIQRLIDANHINPLPARKTA